MVSLRNSILWLLDTWMSILKWSSGQEHCNNFFLFVTWGNYPTLSLCLCLTGKGWEEGEERDSLLWGFFLYGYYSHRRVPPLWPHPTPIYLPKSPSPNTISLEVRTSRYEYWGGDTNIESITLPFSFRPLQPLPKYTRS